MKINPNDPAMPSTEMDFNIESGEYASVTQPGMTIRTYMAGRAMQGYISAGKGSWEDISKWAVSAADALIKELNKEL